MATAQQVFTAAGEGNAHAAHLLGEQARALARLLAFVQAILDPAVVVFGGGIGSRPDVVDRVEHELVPLSPKPASLRVSAVGEDAGVVGAVEVARDRLLLPAVESIGA
jgi:glucokinase